MIFDICDNLGSKYLIYAYVWFFSPNPPTFLLFVFQANGIIKRLQGEVRALAGKIKVKNTVTVSQEKVLQDTSEKLQKVEKDLQSTEKQLITKEDQVCLQSVFLIINWSV